MSPFGARESLVRFGPFEVDGEAQALRRDGRSIPVQQQPFQLLLALLERPGETVTREELRQRLWPDGTCVDFEHSLNTAIKKVRVALDDSPEHPRYVETVRGRGYRLMVPVERLERSTPGEATPGAIRARRRRWLTIALGGLAATVVVVTLKALDPRRGAARSPHVLPLTSSPGIEYQPTFSPDGSHVAFVWCRDGNHDIYVQPVGVLKPSPLTRGPEEEHSPAWSPDGRWIAFIRDPVESTGRARVLVRPPFASGERLVTEYVGRRDRSIWQRQITWTPDSRHLVLSRPDDEGATWSLYLVDVGSGERHRLTESPARDSAPSLSTDGRRLAFSRRVHEQGEIYLLSLGRDLTPSDRPRLLVGRDLLRDVQIDDAYMPAWAPGDREIVFAGFPRGPRLLRVAASGEPRVRSIPARGDLLLDPALSPRTGRLAYAAWETVSRIVRLDVAAGGAGVATPVPFSSTMSDSLPRFSPDGGTVAFSSDRLGSPAVWLSRPDGSDVHRLTPSGTEPAWSPDGRWIAYATIAQDGHRADVYVVPALGGQPRRFTFDPAEDREPTWSPDGQWIYFVSKRDGGTRVWRKPAAGGAPERVSPLEGTEPALSADGRFLFARGWPNEEEVWRMPAGGGKGEVVLRGVAPRALLCLGPSGLYFFAAPSLDGRSTLSRYDLESGEIRRLAAVDGPVARGLALSPDEETVLYTTLDRRQADLQMLEGLAFD